MNKKSFTLVEIIVAAVILAIVAGGMFVVFKSGERFSVEDKKKTEAKEAVRGALEQKKEQASTKTGYDTLSDGKLNIGGKEVEVEVEQVEEGVKRVTAEYDWSFWEEGGEEKEQVQMSTIVTDPTKEVAKGSKPVQ